MSTITETCACGATFATTASTSAAVDYSAAKWREGHKHAESVGICGDRAEPLKVGDTVFGPRPCVLKAGHAGMHGDGEGCHWTRDTDSEPATGSTSAADVPEVVADPSDAAGPTEAHRGAREGTR